MELIGKIKQTETEAQEIIDHAKSQALAESEKGRKNQLAALAAAQQARKKAIEAAIATAEVQVPEEIANLKAQAKKERSQLHKKVDDKTAEAATRVMDYLRG